MRETPTVSTGPNRIIWLLLSAFLVILVVVIGVVIYLVRGNSLSDDARNLYEKGKYEQALSKYDTLLSWYPHFLWFVDDAAKHKERLTLYKQAVEKEAASPETAIKLHQKVVSSRSVKDWDTYDYFSWQAIARLRFEQGEKLLRAKDVPRAFASFKSSLAVEFVDEEEAGEMANQANLTNTALKTIRSKAGQKLTELIINEAKNAKPKDLTTLRQAVSYYEELVGEFGDQRFPGDLASIKNTLIKTYLDLGSKARKEGQYETAISIFKEVLNDFNDAASQVNNQLAATYEAHLNSALAKRKTDPCTTKVELTIVAGYPNYNDKVNHYMPAVSFECAVKLKDEHKLDEAQKAFEQLVKDYPTSEFATQAKTWLIKLEIERVREQNPGALPPPVATGYTGTGSVSVTIYNDSRHQLRVLLDGPTTETYTLEACDSCTDYSGPRIGYIGACSDRPALSITLPAGSYEVVAKTTESSGVNPFYGTWSLDAGSVYESCFYIVSMFNIP